MFRMSMMLSFPEVATAGLCLERRPGYRWSAAFVREEGAYLIERSFTTFGGFFCGRTKPYARDLPITGRHNSRIKHSAGGARGAGFRASKAGRTRILGGRRMKKFGRKIYLITKVSGATG
jgi:hypothetical protein